MRKILIVEDEMPIAELEKDYLELSDFEVTIENDGNEGAKKATERSFWHLLLWFPPKKKILTRSMDWEWVQMIT